LRSPRNSNLNLKQRSIYLYLSTKATDANKMADDLEAGEKRIERRSTWITRRMVRFFFGAPEMC
jgi:hypothetical protein